MSVKKSLLATTVSVKKPLVATTVSTKKSLVKPPAESPVTRLMRELTVSVDDAAVLLRLSRGGAYNAVRDGQIPSIKIGRAIRVPTAALRTMLRIEAAE